MRQHWLALVSMVLLIIAIVLILVSIVLMTAQPPAKDFNCYTSKISCPDRVG